MTTKYIPVEKEITSYNIGVGDRFRVLKPTFFGVILRRKTTVEVKEIINSKETVFAYRVVYKDGTVRNEDPEEFKFRIISKLV